MARSEKVEKWVKDNPIFGDAVHVKMYMCRCLYGGHVFYDSEESADTCMEHWVKQNMCDDCKENVIDDEPALDILSNNGHAYIPFEVVAPEHCAFCMAEQLELN